MLSDIQKEIISEYEKFINEEIKDEEQLKVVNNNNNIKELSNLYKDALKHYMKHYIKHNYEYDDKTLELYLKKVLEANEIYNYDIEAAKKGISEKIKKEITNNIDEMEEILGFLAKFNTDSSKDIVEVCKNVIIDKHNILERFNDDILKAVKLEITKNKRKNIAKIVLKSTVIGTAVVASVFVSREVRKKLTKAATAGLAMAFGTDAIGKTKAVTTGLALALGVDSIDRIRENKSKKEDEHSGCIANVVPKNQNCDNTIKETLECINGAEAFAKDNLLNK